MNALGTSAARSLAARSVLAIDAAHGNAVKRNAHRFVIEAEAGRFADALHRVLIDPEAELGGIRIRRRADQVGRAFAPGERFQGSFTLARRLPWLPRAGGSRLARVLQHVEEHLLSDFAEISELRLEPDEAGERGVSYRYLSGGPMAGQSDYIVRPLGPNRCELEQVFTYQETGLLGVWILHRFGHAAHDRVVLEQVRAAASRCVAAISAHTVRVSS